MAHGSAPVVETPVASTVARFAADVARDLSVVPKRLDPQYLYDDLGSALFGAICELPWYRITRAEKRLLRLHREAIADAAGDRLRVVELGCGTGEKLRVLAEAFARRQVRAEIHLVDVSRHALDQTTSALAGLHLPVVRHRVRYEEGVTLSSEDREEGQHALVLFLGSNIGNFDPAAALELLAAIRSPLVPGDRLLLGVDLVKPARDLRLAYDDPLGVTAAFNKNLLVRMNRELEADFDLQAFHHVARWNEGESRVEMHLESGRRQMVRVPEARITATFFTGETIWTESSYKYEAAAVRAMAQLAGFDTATLWIDQDARFALGMFEAA